MAYLTSATAPTPRGFLARLRSDTAGNVFAMTAAAIVPMIGVVGGAIDLSRLYMVRSRLQAACDSAVLAGRKAMTTAVYDSAARTRAQAMFDFNYQDPDYQSSGTSFSAGADGNGKLSGSARTTVPMTLMRIFGFGTRDAAVSCSADIQVPNIDIVFVLDVTGSMAETINGKTKIQALKEAAKGFYTTLANQMASNGSNAGQLRFGFVPYDQTVNLKDLVKSNPDASKGELGLSHLLDTMPVDTRVANFTLPDTVSEWVEDDSVSVVSYDQRFDRNAVDTRNPYVSSSTSGTAISNNDCAQFSANQSFNITSINLNVTMFPRSSYPGQGVGDSVLYIPEGSSTAQVTQPTSGNSFTRITFGRVSPTWEDNNGSSTSAYQTCVRRVFRTRYVRQPAGYKLRNWTYRTVNLDVSGFKAGSGLTYVTNVATDYETDDPMQLNPVQMASLPNQTGLTRETVYWDGCVEERTTVAASDFSPVPSDAYDLNYLLGGTSDELRWRPAMNDLTYDRRRKTPVTTTGTYSKPGYSCPSARVRNLNPMDKTSFNNYIDTLKPGGLTYLDVGMIWGLRLIVPQGIFAARNLVGPNGGQISRHIIFLTDGEPVSRADTYSAYAVERMANRITGSESTELAASRHAARFQAMCEAQRGSVTIWAIALGTSVTNNLSACADSGRAYQADNASQLNNAFTSIANSIADLRLVS